MTPPRRRSCTLAAAAVALTAAVLASSAAPAFAKADGSSQKKGLSRLAAQGKKASSSRSATSDATCPGTPVKEFGPGTVCADSGFRIRDMPRFANWDGLGRYKEDGYLGPEFVGLFGEENVCAVVEGDSCTLTAEAARYYTTFQKYLPNGRCEGVILVTALMSMGLLRPSSIAPSVGKPSALNPEVPSVVRNINYWWGTQFDQGVISATEKIRSGGIAEIVQLLGNNLRNGVYATMGVYSGQAGHAVLPVALVREASGAYAAVVYDSNTPGRFGRVVLDVSADSWRYQLKGLGGSANGWSGKSGTVDLTPMTVRPKSASCAFCGSREASTVRIRLGQPVVTGAEVFGRG